ncbi:MAG TPA: hypothetical protein VFA32_20070, partial [Dehalococcoidia bacterium]|nr:hypothetical protein [Dehalococcoidia bacterium]
RNVPSLPRQGIHASSKRLKGGIKASSSKNGYFGKTPWLFALGHRAAESGVLEIEYRIYRTKYSR